MHTWQFLLMSWKVWCWKHAGLYTFYTPISIAIGFQLVVVFCFVDWLYYPFTIENCYFNAAKLVHGIKVAEFGEILSEVAFFFFYLSIHFDFTKYLFSHYSRDHLVKYVSGMVVW